ncbi:MAG: FeoC-like transcriptional regulator [Cyanophyceae cyanobacterium]
MILKELQDFVLDYHRVSLAEMELHFHIDGDALRHMLNKLIYKGRVRKVPTPEKCHGCTFCNPDTIEFYEWVDPSMNSPLPKSTPTKAQIHSIHALDEIPHSESTRVSYAVILHIGEAAKNYKSSPSGN